MPDEGELIFGSRDRHFEHCSSPGAKKPQLCRRPAMLPSSEGTGKGESLPGWDRSKEQGTMTLRDNQSPF